MVHDFDELAATYWQHCRSSTATDRADRLMADATSYAWDETEERVRSEPENELRVMIDCIEGGAARNDNFRRALRCAWFDEHPAPPWRNARSVLAIRTH